MPSALLFTSPASPAIGTKCRGSSGSAIGTNNWRARNADQFGMAGLDDVSGSDDKEGVVGAPVHQIQVSSTTFYPGIADGEPILW